MSDGGDQLIRTSTNVRITVRELYEMVYIFKWSDSKIAKKIGLSSKTIRNYRRKCQFDTTFKTGVMDLPLHEVKDMVAKGKSDEEIVKHFNTTITAFQSFRRRFNLSQNPTWPPDRRDLIDMCLSEYYPQEIASAFGVDLFTVVKTMRDLKISPFYGTKSAKILRKEEAVNPDEHETLEDAARKILGDRIKYNIKVGYVVDGQHVSIQKLMVMIGYKNHLIGV